MLPEMVLFSMARSAKFSKPTLLEMPPPLPEIVLLSIVRVPPLSTPFPLLEMTLFSIVSVPPLVTPKPG